MASNLFTRLISSGKKKQSAKNGSEWTYDEKKEYRIKNVINKVSRQYESKIQSLQEEITAKDKSVNNLLKRLQDLESETRKTESKHRRSLERLERNYQEQIQQKSSKKSDQAVRLRQHIEELQTEKNSLIKSQKENRFADARYYNQLLPILRNTFPESECSETLNELLIAEFFYTRKRIEHLLLPYLMQFENQVRNWMNKLMFSDMMADRVYKSGQFRNYSEENNYTLQSLLEKMSDHPENFIDYLNEQMGQKNFRGQKIASTLRRIAIGVRQEKANEWNFQSLEYLKVIIFDIKVIRNIIVHSTYSRETNLLKLISANRCLIMNNFVVNRKARWNLYTKMGIGHFAKINPQERNTEILQYPIAIALLSFFNQEYILVKLLSEVAYAATNFSSINAFKLIDRRKVLTLFGLRAKEQELLQNIFHRFEFERFVKR